MLWAFAIRALGFARSAAQGAFAFARAYPWQAALFAAMCLSGWLWLGKRDALADRDKARAEVQSIALAQKVATARAYMARRETERQSAEIAERAEHELAETRAELRGALARYADANRVRSHVGSAASGTVATALPDNPAHPDGGPSDSSMVAVSEADLNDLAEGAVQAAVWRQFGQGLVDAGLAVVGE